MAWRGGAWLAWRGSARLGLAWQGKAWQAWPVWAWQGEAGRGRHGPAWQGMARRGEARQARPGVAGRGWAGQGMAWQGAARLGRAGQGAARRGKAWQARRGLAGRGVAGQGMARHGEAGTARRGMVGRGWARQGSAWQAEKAWRDWKVATGCTTSHARKSSETQHLWEKMMSDRVEIARIDAETLHVPIVGTAPLIVHNFAEKAKREMLEREQGKKKVKEIRDPQAEYEAAFYLIASDDGPRYGFPVTAFKAATTGAARFYDKSVSMTALRQFLFMRGILTKADPQQLVEIHGDPEMREDMVRLGGPARSADLRYRPMFPEWSTVLDVTYVKSSIDRGSVLSLIDAGGMGIGVGEWRPERRGEFGTYAIDRDREIGIDQ